MDKSASYNFEENNVRQILEEQQRIRLSELESLRNENKTVSNSNYKHKFELLLNQRIGKDEIPSTSSNGNPPSKSESVRVEVESLVARRPVSSILNRSVFRRQLEQAIRGSLDNIFNPLPRGQPRSSQFVQRGNGAPSHSSGEPSTGLLNSRPNTPRSSSTNTAEQSFSVRSVSSRSEISSDSTNTNQSGLNASNSSQNIISAQINDGGFYTDEEIANIGVWRPVDRNEVGPGRAGEWIQSLQLNDEQRERNQLLLEENRRENLISEISELVHQQIVTTTLHSRFRDTLENQVLERINRAGHDGQAVQQFINSLPAARDRVRRNDFSSLGLAADAAELALSEELSVISATAAVHIPRTHEQITYSSDIKQLKQDVKELKQLMKQNHEVIMDIQRSIRQEVSAAVNINENFVRYDITKTLEVHGNECLVCLNNYSNSIIYRCGHLCACYKCALELKKRDSKCPVCRAKIYDIVKVFQSS